MSTTNCRLLCAVDKDQKKELGQRLMDARLALGHPKRPSFAALLNIPADTLGSYERGIREPEMALLAIYGDEFGINLNWLASGKGPMFDSKALALDGNSAQLLHDFQKLPEDRQLDIIDIVQITLKRVQHG